MRAGPDNRLTLIRRYDQACENGDRSAVEQLLHSDSAFTSPGDDRIDRATYSERCWPGHESIQSFTLLDVSADGHGALIRYWASEFNKPGLVNAKH
jgi:ketosteroid isomerase-like protein